jgi:DNA topoisomerase-1
MLTTQQDPRETAQDAGLRYVTDTKPGITRKRSGKGWHYTTPNGDTLKDPAALARIKTLAIPPAWRKVWICPTPDGHIQATGLDAKDRKQYRYHPRWREVRDSVKYERMIAFGKALPDIRKRVDHDLALPGLPREKVLATVVRLLETTLIRVGNEEYARTNKSFGLTTLRNRHVKVNGSELRFSFRGKSGKTHKIGIKSKRLARIVAGCQELPGQELFGYKADDGTKHTIGSSDINAYLKEISGHDFTAKDFRTWAGTVLAASCLQAMDPSDTKTMAKHNVVAAIAQVAERLGNTPAICRKSYVHPAVIESYLDGTLAKSLKRKSKKLPKDLPPLEASVLRFLRKRLKAA